MSETKNAFEGSRREPDTPSGVGDFSGGRKDGAGPGARSLDAKDVTYCMGYWNFGGNKKRSGDHYTSLLPGTIHLLRGANLLFFHDSPSLCDDVESLAQQHDINMVSRQCPVDSLPEWDVALDAVRACQDSALDRTGPKPKSFQKDKSVAHFWRDLKGSGPEVYRMMLAIWLSKVPLVNAVAKENPFGTGLFAWVDASASRFVSGRGDWNYSKRPVVPGRISHYVNGMRMHGKALPLNASVLLGDRQAWNRFALEFEKAVPVSLCEPYGHDEETIISSVFKDHPDLFHRLKRLNKESGRAPKHDA